MGNDAGVLVGNPVNNRSELIAFAGRGIEASKGKLEADVIRPSSIGEREP